MRFRQAKQKLLAVSDVLRNYKTIVVAVLAIVVATLLLIPATETTISIDSAQFALSEAPSVINAQQTANWFEDKPTDIGNLESKQQKQNFRLLIPSIGVNKKVIENVHPAREDIYGPVIENYVAHGMYTRLPDEAMIDGNVYLFAHREGNVAGKDVGFFRNLDKLNNGDKAQVIYGDKTYTYQAYRSFVIEPEDTWVYGAESDFPTLTLQTCENGEEQRLIVKLKLIEVSEA
jgi:LPXTG-site transpeptidase (sortase) family protein